MWMGSNYGVDELPRKMRVVEGRHKVLRKVDVGKERLMVIA